MRPDFDYGDEVRVLRNVRNDGTYPGLDVGKLLVRRGSVGYVRDVGTFLQDQIIYRYHLLRAALRAGQPGLAELEGSHLADISRQADKSFDLESLVLGSAEAARVLIPPGRIADALSELRSRYTDRDAFLSDLAGNGLDEEILGQALERELIFDAVMQAVSSNRLTVTVTEIDERLFFELHKERFVRPERRTARHILITVNEQFEENCRDAARNCQKAWISALRRSRSSKSNGTECRRLCQKPQVTGPVRRPPSRRGRCSYRYRADLPKKRGDATLA